LIRSLRTTPFAGDPLVGVAKSAPSFDIDAILARLEDRGDRVLRGRRGAVRIWTSTPAAPKPAL
jgi:hypothetical protein